MGKISSEMRRFSGAPRSGFSLVEILVVVLIMGILVGVVGSLMGGFITNFEVTDDQSVARRRAQDVFNILQLPILYAGMGIPADHFDYYFGPPSGGAPIKTWGGPISTNSSGDVLRVVYSIPAGVKHTGTANVEDFMADTSDDIQQEVPGPVSVPLSDNIIEGPDTVTVTADHSNVHSYVTFPGIRMHPEFVTNIPATGNTISLAGRTPYQVVPGDTGDVLPQRNVIRAYHDLHFVRAGVGYVDANHTFVFTDVTTVDTSSTRPPANNVDGYRVEGIRAMYIEQDAASKSVTVYVIAEGDNAVTGRSDANIESRVFRNETRWTDQNVTYDPEVYYEEFQMRWRSRNIEAPGA